jgi:hypothetical protein
LDYGENRKHPAMSRVIDAFSVVAMSARTGTRASGRRAFDVAAL